MDYGGPLKELPFTKPAFLFSQGGTTKMERSIASSLGLGKEEMACKAKGGWWKLSTDILYRIVYPNISNYIQEIT